MPTIASLLTDRPVVTLTADASALDAARTMTERRVGALLVIDSAQRPSGIFTERDLMTRVVVPGRDPATTRLAEVMTRELFVTSPDARIAAVRQELQRLHIRHVPVVEGGRFVALLSLRDLLRADLEECSIERHKLTEYIHGSETP
jgi:CBS domain-containing protein